MRFALLINFLLLSIWAYPQSLKEELEAIDSFEEAQRFQATYNGYVERHTFRTVDQLSSEQQLILEHSNKGVFSIEHYTYCVYEASTYLASNVRYIYFDGSQFSKSTVDSLRGVIQDQYQQTPSEENFIALVNSYSMDGNPNGGLLSWYEPRIMQKEFAAAVLNQQAGDIFQVDIPEMGWYYVVLKLDDDKEITSTSYLKVRTEQDD